MQTYVILSILIKVTSCNILSVESLSIQYLYLTQFFNDYHE